jgi:RNA polymerase sigma-70 factor (ECF subfamily)
MAADVETGSLSLVSDREAMREADFERLLQPVLGSAFRLANTILRDRQEAEDAVQEAALNAWRRFDAYRDQGKGIEPWFLTIVANQCRSRLRSRWWRVWRHPDIDFGSTPSHEEAVLTRSRLAQAVERLTAEHRSVLFLHYQLDLPNDEIARILGLRVGTVKSRLNRATAQLRLVIGKETHHV